MNAASTHPPEVIHQQFIIQTVHVGQLRGRFAYNLRAFLTAVRIHDGPICPSLAAGRMSIR